MKPMTMETLKTSDTQFAAYCYLQGAQLVSVDRRGHRCVFEFETETDVEKLKQDFRDNPLVRAQDFIAAQASMKKALFSDVY